MQEEKRKKQRKKRSPSRPRFIGTVPTCSEIRKMSGLSQRNFADCYGIPYPSIINWERGIRKPPDYLMLMLERIVREDTGTPVEAAKRKYPQQPLSHFPKKMKQKGEEKGNMEETEHTGYLYNSSFPDDFGGGMMAAESGPFRKKKKDEEK